MLKANCLGSGNHECVVVAGICKSLPCLSTVAEAEVDECCSVAGDATTPAE